MDFSILSVLMEGDTMDVVAEVNKRISAKFESIKGRNPHGFLDQFESQFENIMLNIAMDLNLNLDIRAEEDGKLTFLFISRSINPDYVVITEDG